MASLTSIDREQSLLQFNHRVLQLARYKETPLLERLRYLCIVSNNLDEFFEVRVLDHLNAFQHKQKSGAFSEESFENLSKQAHELVAEQYAIYHDEIMPALSSAGIKVLSHGERNEKQRKWVEKYFETEVKPILTPLSLDSAHPFPKVANKALHFIVRLNGKDAYGRENEIAIVRVPRSLARIVALPENLCAIGEKCFVTISSIIRAQLESLFEGRRVSEFSQFRVTRHSDMAIDEEDVKNLRKALRQGLEKRPFGQAVRLEVNSGCSDYLLNYLTKHFQLPPQSIYKVNGPVNLVRFMQLCDMANEPELLFSKHSPMWPKTLLPDVPILTQVAQSDILIHQPFQSFDGVMSLLREAVDDPQVISIRQTIYRIGSDSVMMELLRTAVRRGIEVMVVVEIQARFDEETNINWAEIFEEIGAQVVYGVLGLKTHCKMLLITRKEPTGLRLYGHLSTGNYNPKTAKLYTDFSYLTMDPKITADMEKIFLHLASQSKLEKLEKIICAPFYMQKAFIQLLQECIDAVQAGEDSRVVLKMNALTDEKLIAEIIKASQAGVKLDLIVRGACMLRPNVPGFTDNVRIRSVIGRFLEHSRVYYFRAGKKIKLYLSSADWMSRNMLRRVEIAWPVEDPQLQQRIIDEALVPYMLDEVDAWQLDENGQYTAATGDAAKSAQLALMYKYTS